MCCAVQFVGQFVAAGPLSASNVRLEKGFVASLLSFVLSHQPENSGVYTQKSAVPIFHQLTGCGLKMHDSRGLRNLGIDDCVGYSFSSKSVIHCNLVYLPTDNNSNFSLEINILQL